MDKTKIKILQPGDEAAPQPEPNPVKPDSSFVGMTSGIFFPDSYSLYTKEIT